MFPHYADLVEPLRAVLTVMTWKGPNWLWADEHAYMQVSSVCIFPPLSANSRAFSLIKAGFQSVEFCARAEFFRRILICACAYGNFVCVSRRKSFLQVPSSAQKKVDLCSTFPLCERRKIISTNQIAS